MAGKYGIMVKGIVNYENKFLIVQKWYDDRITDPYQWEFIDGKLEFGEEPDKAVIRVITQDAGMVPYLDKILYAWSYMTGETQNIGVAYLCTTMFDEVILSEEYTDYKWVEASELRDYISNQLILKDLEKIQLI